MQRSLDPHWQILSAGSCERRRLFLAALAASLVTLPCWWLLAESAYAAHPSYTHKFGDMVRSFFTYSHDRWRFLQIVAFVVGFTLLQEICLKRWPVTRQRLKPAAAAILALTATVGGLVLAMEGSLHAGGEVSNLLANSIDRLSNCAWLPEI